LSGEAIDDAVLPLDLLKTAKKLRSRANYTKG
jgi:hypothetical protein